MSFWVDFHTHILDFLGLEECIKRSERAHVKHWLVNSVDYENWSSFQKIQENAPLAIIGLGWHPEQAMDASPEKIVEQLRKFSLLVKNAPYLGETGLDFLYGKTAAQQDAQKRVFSQFIDWSNEHEKMIQVHTRHAKQEAMDMLQEKKAERVILHWFSGNEKQQKMVIRHQWVCTVGPTILHSPHMDHFIERQPLELLGLETDSPIPFDGKPSAPDWIPLVARRVAEIKKISLEEVSNAQRIIFSRFFPEHSIN